MLFHQLPGGFGGIFNCSGPHFLNLQNKGPGEVIERLAFASKNLCFIS